MKFSQNYWFLQAFNYRKSGLLIGKVFPA